jgi:hypothetical protein
MKLTYEDILLHPTETISEHSIELDDEASGVATFYLLKIAQRSLTRKHAGTLQRLQKEIEDLKEDDEARGRKVQEMIDYILSADSWAQAKAKILRDPDHIRETSAEEYLALVEEIGERARQLSIKLEPEEKSAMERYLDFWRKRIAASKTMILSTKEIVETRKASIVAMVVGAAHTKGMCNMLSDADCPFAVVTPLSLKKGEEVGDLTWDMLERKYQRSSIYSEGFMETLLETFPLSKQKKPEPVLSESWFQAKAELYIFAERIARGVLGPPSPPGGGEAPYGFPDDDFEGRWVVIDPKRISVETDTRDGKGRAVLFPAILNPRDSGRRTEIWIKAGLGRAIVPQQERETVESMLQKALEEVKKEGSTRRKLEDESGRVQITLNTVAGFARTRRDAQNIILGSI